MDSILGILTRDEKDFIKHHGISPSDIYDARGMTTKEYHDKAKAHGCPFVINYCKYGHRLKTRNGHCIVCHPDKIAFQKREINKGVIYIAYCGKYTKVGMIENNINSKNTALNKREYTLNSEGGYAGRDDWQTIMSWQLDKYAGKVEREAHKLLEKYKVDKDYIYSGELRNAKELFECPIQTAIDAVKKAIELYK